jgi:hypothetical protein
LEGNSLTRWPFRKQKPITISKDKPLPDASPELLALVEENKEPFNCMIEDEELGTVFAYIDFNGHLPWVMIPTYTEVPVDPDKPFGKTKIIKDGEEQATVSQWKYYNDQVYWLRCRKKNSLKTDPAKSMDDFLDRYLIPIEPASELAEILPDGLWRALHRAYDFIPIEFETPPPEWIAGFMKYAIIALIVGAFIFVVAKGK